MNWSTILRLAILSLLVIGHIGLWIFLFNRINATGLHRRHIKAIEKGIVLVCLLLPVALLVIESKNDPDWSTMQHWIGYLMDQSPPPKLSIWSFCYGLIAFGFGLIVGPIWLLHRPQFHMARDRYQVIQTHIDKHLHRKNSDWKLGSKAQKSLGIPGNELMHLEANTKALWIDDLPDKFVDMKIGHLSDIHLTGQLPDGYYRHALEWLVSQRIELLCLSGDIIDKPGALPSLQSIFGGLTEQMPKLFVLGNHDRACGLDQQVREVLTQIGWLDVGDQDRRLQTARGKIEILGNERPWFHRELSEGFSGDCSQARESEVPEFRIGISHSPDQILWARKLGISLLLCGHTHGGQIRLPWIGPVIAPSKYGSRFASGVFHQAPTLMHVSRGLSGVHPIRLGCLPEVTVLELRKRS
ncbi:MAG: metallophosphoesterase [Pirellula sp.]